MDETIGDRVRRLRTALGLNQSELAEMIGKAPQRIQSLEAGTIKNPRYLVRLAEVLKVTPQYLETGQVDPVNETLPVGKLRVEGIVEAGNFRDITIIEDDEYERETIPVAMDGRYSMFHQYALRVVGDSMNLLYPAGSYVTCVSWAEAGLEWKDGMIVHVERYRAGLVETTIKALQLVNGRPKFLLPQSTNPKHKPIEINGDEDTEIIIKGLVTGMWRRQEY